MRVEVLRVVDPTAGIVSFRSDVGAVSGRWMGPGIAEVGQFDVEIEMPDEVSAWTEVSSAVTSLSEADTGTLVVVGEVVQVGEGDDPVVTIRLGTDLLLIEISNSRPGLPLAGLISFRVPEIQLYPYTL